MKDGEHMSKTILSFLDKQAISLRSYRSTLETTSLSPMLLESQFEEEIKERAKKLIGTKIHALRRISTTISSARNQITLDILSLKEAGAELDPELLDESDLLQLKV